MNPLRSLPTLSLVAALIAAGCSGAPPAAVTPSAAPSVAASATPGATAEPSASATSTAAPSAAPNYVTALLRGTVYDVDGKTVEKATVRVRSLDASRPFEATAETAAGKYAIPNVPVDTQIEVSATRPDWTTRTRIEALRNEVTGVTNRNVVNFGGNYDDVDPIGMAYFISDYPEIERVEPLNEATSQPNNRMNFKLILSERLDTVNQRRLSSAFMIVPNDQEALGEGAQLPSETATDVQSVTESELVGLFAGASPATTSAYRYRQNTGFLNGAVISEFKWDADGRTATFSLDAPVKTGRDEEAEYAFLLVQQDKDPIVDAQRLPLGMNEDNAFGRTIRGEVLRNAVRQNEVSLDRGRNDDAEERWAATHLSYTTFAVATDRTAPQLVSVLARRSFSEGATGSSDRVELTFSEPMIAFPEIASKQLLSLNNYILSAAPSQEDADKRKLGPNGKAVAVTSGSGFELARDAIAAEAGAVIGTNSALMSGSDGNYSVSLSVTNPRVVIIRMPVGALPLDANVIKVYAGSDNGAPEAAGQSITDPAGNSVQDNVQSGPIF